jgi:hypothetical protein
MLKLIFPVCVMPLICFACLTDNYSKIPDGVYNGAFQRQLTFVCGDIAHISIIFSGNTRTGVNDKLNFPALCHRTYTTKNHKITCINDCEWIAQSDRTLILGGDYDFSYHDKKLNIIRENRGPATDTYADIYNLTFQ